MLSSRQITRRIDKLQTLTLHWQKAGTFLNMLDPQVMDAGFLAAFCQPGLYIWVESNQQHRFFCYIGKASQSVLQRTLEHYTHFLHLRYSIPSRYNNGLRYVAADPVRYSTASGYDAVLSPQQMSLPERQQKLQALRDYLSSIEIFYASVPEFSQFTQSKEFNQALEQVEKQLISDCMPVENILATSQTYAFYQLNHQGDLTGPDFSVLRENGLAELVLDPTRPSKARARNIVKIRG